LSKQRLSELIAKVTSNPSYRDKARWFQNVLRETRGLDVAADIIVFGVANEIAQSTRGNSKLNHQEIVSGKNQLHLSWPEGSLSQKREHGSPLE
jgi:hypothetical protein